MATVGITLSHTSRLDGNAAVLVDNDEVQSEAITTVSATSVPSTITATDTTQVARVVVTGSDVWVTFGATPVAAAGTKFLILDGTVEYFAVNVGDKIAVYEPAA